MESYIEVAKDFKELAGFLAELNNQKASHSGYCGHKAEEIYETLKADFVKEDGKSTFIIARNIDGKIDTAIGFDIDGETAEVWGPFHTKSSLNAQNLLWKQLLQEYPTLVTFYFFLNKENVKQQEFMKMIQANKTGEHLVLEVEKQSFEGVQDFKSTKFVQSDFQAFESIHEITFPNTYYNAQTIVSRLNAECILKVLRCKSGEMLGYAYYEVDLEMNEATLHYFAIAPAAQNHGYGTMLLKEVITEIFKFPEIREIKLCVDFENDKANHIYFKVGFEERNHLYSYRLKLK